jgi:hypothetical protein
MAGRRPSGKAILAAAAALAALVGAGVAVWLGTSGDDHPIRGTTSVATTPDATLGEAEPAPGSPTGTTPRTNPAQPNTKSPQPAPTETTTKPTRKTRFPHNRRERRARPIPHDFAIPPAREFSGNGNARLGTVDLRQPSVVKWSTQGRFELRFGREAFPIIAPSATGQLIVPAYSFELVRVIANGRWKISITPQK